MNHSFKSKLAVTSALVAALCGYGRRAYAACSSTGSATYLCSGYNVSTQTISANEATVSTASGFGVNTASGNAITVTGDGALSFTDTNASTITTTYPSYPNNSGLKITASGDDSGTPGSITINANSNITGYSGIEALNGGTGATAITANGTVTSTGTYSTAIFGQNSDTGTNLTITTGVGSVIAGGSKGNGIFAYNFGTGATTITANGDVTGGSGIYARVYGSGLTINTGTGGNITGIITGITASNYGTGALLITANGAVTGTTDNGIFAHNSGTATNLSITTGTGSNITGGTNGIYAYNKGSGITSVTVNGDVTGNSGDGVKVTNGKYTYPPPTFHHYGTNLIVNTGTGSTITGSTNGIEARNYGSGYLSVAANGAVTGTSGYGILAQNSKYGTNLSITTGTASTVTGSSSGIYARNNGTGYLSITANGSVTGASKYGIFAFNPGSAGITITTGVDSSITGGRDGIRAFGSGATTITANGNVTGTTGNGIYAAAGSDLTITTGTGSTIIGGFYGIHADSYLTGALSIAANGTVTGTTRNGIYAGNSGTNLTITTGTSSTITGGTNGIYAKNQGTGYLSITANGTVTGTGNNGIYARNSGTNLSITTEAGSNVTGGFAGIYARNHGTGYLSVTANGTVTGTTGEGIWAQTYGTTNLSITTGTASNVTGGNIGIFATNYGVGATTITANGAITGTSNYGIRAYNSSNGTNLTITTGTSSHVTGGYYGITAKNYGTGALSITANGNVVGTTDGGIYAKNSSTATNLTITTGTGSTITGGTTGIYAQNHGTGYLSIIANGDVTSTNSRAIYAGNSATGTNLTVTTGTGSNITGGSDGIFVNNLGTGATTITVNGNITTTNPTNNGYGIYAYNKGASLTITTGVGSNITGGAAGCSFAYGIRAHNLGTGATTITIDGDVTGINTTGHYYGGGVYQFHGHYRFGSGIDAYNGTGTGALSITTGASSIITGSNYGIFALNTGTGATTININGDVTGTRRDGIQAYNYATATNMNIATATGATISGGRYGINVHDLSTTGSLTISNASGATIYGGVAGIYVNGNGGAAGSITNAGTIEGAGGTAISLNNLTAALPITITGGHIIGDVVDNDPSLGFSPVTIAGNFTSQGNFDVSGFNVSTGDTFTFGAGDTVTSYNAVSDSGTIKVLSAGSSVTGDLDVNTGGALKVGADFGVSGAFTNNGATDIATGSTLTVGTMAAGTGTLDFGLTSSSDHAELVVTGGGANLTNQTIDINVAGVNSLSSGEQILLVHGNAPITGGPGGTPEAVTDNSALWSFTVVDGTAVNTPTSADDLFVLVSMAASPFAPTSNNISLSQTLLGLEGTSNPQLSQIITNLNSAPTTQAANTILGSLEPPLSGGSFFATQSFSDNSLNLANQRLASLRYGDGTGLATGDVPYLDGVKAWVQFFGESATQDERDGIAGYTVHGLGSTFGMDTKNLLDNAIVGAAFSYGHAEVLASDANSTHTGIDSYQFALYSDYDLGNGYYVNGLAGYTFSNNSTLRQNVGEVPGLSAQGSFDANEFAATVESGRAIRAGITTLTPFAVTDWTYYRQQSYTETGAGGADLSVDSQAISYLDLGIGGKASWDFQGPGDGAHIVPELHTSFRHDFIGDSVDATASFTGGGQQFVAEGASPAQNKFNVGAQVKYYDTGDVELTANYDLDAKQGYLSQTAYLKAAYKF